MQTDAAQLHSKSLVIDGHNDTIVSHLRRATVNLSGAAPLEETRGTVSYIRGNLASPSAEFEIQINFPKMKAGNIDAALFAVDVTLMRNNHLIYALDALGALDVEINAAGDDVVLALSADDILQAKRDGNIAVIMAVENSDATEGSLNVLRMLHKVGVRSMGLTHNTSSRAADGNGEAQTGGGLTTFGVELVREMNQIGMVVDVAHISEAGYRDVVEVSSQPIIVSHTTCSAICDHPRNLTDDQIKSLAENGGVMGVTFVPSFVDATNPTFDRLIDHIDHAVQLVGPEYVGIGSDFDGGGTLIESAEAFPSFTEVLIDRNYRPEDIRLILGENFLRVFKKVWV
ncbi:MAG: dipeptidase [Candidatus Latescibacterota bacterium]|nr:dipeptidase [Candidatus Latescibacterota bacterium]